MTSGVENCKVVAACPIEVSGTGALTGIMMAYEVASGEELSEEQKETAVEELVTTGELADEIGQEEATDLMNEIKEEVIKEVFGDFHIPEDSTSEKIDEYIELLRSRLKTEYVESNRRMLESIEEVCGPCEVVYLSHYAPMCILKMKNKQIRLLADSTISVYYEEVDEVNVSAEFRID